MAPKKRLEIPIRQQPKRAAGRPRPVYIPEASNPWARPNAGVKKAKSVKSEVKRNKTSRPQPDARIVEHPSSSKNKTKKQSSYVRLGSVDSVLFDPSGDPLARQDRWIPELGQRPQLVSQPSSSLISPELWTAYCALDDYMYNLSVKHLRPEGLEDQHRSLQRGHQTQPSKRPSSVDVTLWSAYRMLEAWVYRAGLTADEVVIASDDR